MVRDAHLISCWGTLPLISTYGRQDTLPAAHAGSEVAPGLAQHDDHAPCHVFAAMVAHPFHHGGSPGVAHGEPLSGDAPEVALAPGGAVEDGVADEDVVVGVEAALGRRRDDQPPPGPTAKGVKTYPFRP